MTVCMLKLQGFLTDSGNVNLDRVQLIMGDLGNVEDEIFKKRQQNEIAFKEREKAKKRRAKLSQGGPAWVPQGQFAPQVNNNNNIDSL
jgi:5''-3'' exonuclease